MLNLSRMLFNRFRALPGVFFLFLACMLPYLSAAQEEGGGFKVKKSKAPVTIREKESTAVKALIIGIGAGYGRMNWKHEVSNVYLNQGNNVLLPGPGTQIGYFNLAQTTNTRPGEPNFNFSEKSTVKYVGKGSAIPFTLDLLYAVNDFRIGLTGSYELLSVNKLTVKESPMPLEDVTLEGKTRLWKYGLKLEYMFTEIGDFRLGGQSSAGLFSLKGNYDKNRYRKSCCWVRA